MKSGPWRTDTGRLGRTLWTFTIVTTDANEEFSWLHDRQPVFLMTRDAIDKWLDTSSQTWTSDLNKMVQPYHHSVTLTWYVIVANLLLNRVFDWFAHL